MLLLFIEPNALCMKIYKPTVSHTTKEHQILVEIMVSNYEKTQQQQHQQQQNSKVHKTCHHFHILATMFFSCQASCFSNLGYKCTGGNVGYACTEIDEAIE